MSSDRTCLKWYLPPLYFCAINVGVFSNTLIFLFMGFARKVLLSFESKTTAQSPTFSSVKDLPGIIRVATNAILFATM